jgi:cytochrome c peroxidase
MKALLRATAIILGLQLLLLAFSSWFDREQGNDATIGDPAALLGAYERFRDGQADTSSISIRLGPLQGQPGSSDGLGEFSLDLIRGTVSVKTRGLDDAEVQHVFMIDERASVASAVIDLGTLSAVPGGAALEASLDLQAAIGFEIDRVVVGAASDVSALAGSPSLFQRLYYHEQRLGRSPTAEPSAPQVALPFLPLIPAPANAQAAGGPSLAGFIQDGERLFFNESFDGNGRTCGTCHPANNNFTIDPTFIATLPNDDPLFVAEFDPALFGLEDPQLLRDFGLVLANVDGFEDPTNKFVMRSVSHLLGTSMTIQNGAPEAPFQSLGWGGDGAPGDGRLRDFSTGAVTQHFTRNLDRDVGVDFRLPTQGELDALEAFMLSIGRQAEFDLKALRLSDSTAERGRQLFTTEDSENQTVQAAKCSLCHMNGGSLTVEGVNRNFDTGVEQMIHPVELGGGGGLPLDGGFGTQLDAASGAFGTDRFNVASLWEAADTAPFFHHHGAATLEDAISFYDSPEFKNSAEGSFIEALDSGGQELSVEIDDLAAFLRVINTIENVRSASEYMRRARDVPGWIGKRKLLRLAQADLEDAGQVLNQGELHPQTVAGLGDAMASVTAAILSANANSACSGQALVATNQLISDGMLEAVVARDHMLNGPLVQLPQPIAVPQLASSAPPPPPPTPNPNPLPGQAVCTIYGCSGGVVPPPPDPGTPPDPSTPPTHSAEGEAIGLVAAVDLTAFTVTVTTSEGFVTLQVTTATIFKGSVASHLGQVVVGHEIDAAFFIATNQVEQLETNFPDL